MTSRIACGRDVDSRVREGDRGSKSCGSQISSELVRLFLHIGQVARDRDRTFDVVTGVNTGHQTGRLAELRYAASIVFAPTITAVVWS
jgi:hypothetical protein